jgi:hypothetical protein
MSKEIINTYIGLPNNLKKVIRWVQDKYRKNTLSLITGGSDIIVEYIDSKVYGYNKIKFPSKYIKSILLNTLFSNIKDFDKLEIEDQLKLVKKEIATVYIKEYQSENENENRFEKIWDSTSTRLPWKELELFDSSYDQNRKNISVSFPFDWDFLLANQERVLKLFSTHFPFSTKQLIKFKDHLVIGNELEYCNGYEIWPQPGLIFNDNICWNKEIKTLFQREPSEIFMYDGGSYIRSSLDFGKIPYSRQKTRIEFNDFLFYKSSVYSEEEEEFHNQLECQAKFKESAAYNFSINEMKYIISEGNYHSDDIEMLNRNFFNQFLDILNTDIVNFEVDKLIEIIKKNNYT